MTTTKTMINNLLETIVNPQLKAVSDKLARLEPYTYNSPLKEELLKLSNELTNLYDYVKAIADGEEEASKEELETLFRIITSKAISGGMVTESRISPIVPPAATSNGIDLYINGVSYSSAAPTIIRPYNTYDFIARFNDTAKLIRFELDGIAISEVGNIVYVDNFLVRSSEETTKTITVIITKQDDTTITGTFTLTVQNS